jgi:plasmid stability protein
VAWRGAAKVFTGLEVQQILPYHYSKGAMADLTIRNLDDSLQKRLFERAALAGRSVEEEARYLLEATLRKNSATPDNLATAIQRRFRQIGGVNLAVAKRTRLRKLTDGST